MTTTTLPGIPSTVQAGVINVQCLGQVPVVDMPRFDERQTCATVLRYLAGDIDGRPSDYTACPQYRGGACARGSLCAFLEPDRAPVWRKAAAWRLLRLPDGSEAVTLATSAVEIAASYAADLVEVR